jgi:hypothetical protein
MVLAVVLTLPGLEPYNPLLQASGRNAPRPENALAAVQESLQRRGASGNIFTRFEWGEYFSWAASPEFHVFMDGRIEIYPDDVWQQYQDVTTGQGNWQQILDQYQVQYLVLDPRYHADNGLLAQVEQSPHWHRVFQVRDDIYLYAR